MGGTPRRLMVSGHDLKNIEVLRTFDDSQRLLPHAKLDQNVVIIGSSFIGMESAAALAKGGAKVTVVGTVSLTATVSFSSLQKDCSQWIMKAVSLYLQKYLYRIGTRWP